MPPTRDAPPVFIGAAPRSGTTLLRTMLNSHPELAIPRETHILVDGYRTRAEWGDLRDVDNRRRLARWVVEREHSQYRQLTADPDELVASMVAAPPTLGSVLGAGFRLYADRHGKPRWGDKRPSIVLNLDAVYAMFPDAQFVNLVRDPRAVVASIRRVGRRHGWDAYGLPGATDTWERSIRAADRWRKRLGPDQFLEVRYEDLVTEPAATLGQIVEFLDLDAAGLDAMLRHHETADIHNRTMHALVSKPVTTERLRAWEQALRPKEIAFVESVVGEGMRRYGYEPTATGASVPPELRRRHRRRRNEMHLQSARRRSRELWLQLSYRRPVAAQR